LVGGVLQQAADNIDVVLLRRHVQSRETILHTRRHAYQLVCVQLPTSAENVTLPAFTAEGAGRAAIDDRYLLAAGPTAANPPQRRRAAAER